MGDVLSIKVLGLRAGSSCNRLGHSVLEIEQLERAWAECSARLLLILRPLGGATEDAVQEAYMALFELDRLPENPLAWLVTVARHRLIQWQRGENRRDARQRQTAASWFQTPSTPSDHDIEELTMALRNLPPEQAEVITMHIWGELSFDAIGAIVGKSRSAAHRTYASGLEQLRRCLDETIRPPLMATQSNPTGQAKD